MLAIVINSAENKLMNHEVSQPEDRVTFLSEFFADKFNPVAPEWVDIKMTFAVWRVIPLNDGNRKVLAYRTSPAGVVDSFSLNLDRPDEFEHIVTGQDSSISEVCKSIDAQYEMGITVPNEDDQNVFDELIDALRALDATG